MKKKSKSSDYYLHKNIPQIGLNLTKYSGDQLIERIGQDIINEVVTSILCGGNVRALTEGLTQRRLFLSNASLLVAYLNASRNIPNFTRDFTSIISNELITHELTSEQRTYLRWFIGLTEKSVQNVLRSDTEKLSKYLSDLDKSLKNAAQQSIREFGILSGSVLLGNDSFLLSWPALLQIFIAIGTQTLAIRGSEKSMYGKLFEKLILGSMLSILGFEMVDPNISRKTTKVFWLSKREDKRESDATVLIKPGSAIRFDIGFIGPGNTEISLDKVSRFERELEHGRQHYYTSTFILVDRIGEGSRILDLAKKIDGTIVQMSMTYWIKEISILLFRTSNYRHPILKMSDEESISFVKEQMKKINLYAFIK